MGPQGPRIPKAQGSPRPRGPQGFPKGSPRPRGPQWPMGPQGSTLGSHRHPLWDPMAPPWDPMGPNHDFIYKYIPKHDFYRFFYKNTSQNTIVIDFWTPGGQNPFFKGRRHRQEALLHMKNLPPANIVALQGRPRAVQVR